MSVTARRLPMFGTAAIFAPFFLLFVACEDAAAPSDASSGGSSAENGGTGTGGSSAGGSGGTGGLATSGGSGGATTGGSSGAGAGGTAAGGTGSGGTAGAAGGGAGGTSGAGGSGGASCGTIEETNDGSYVRDGWTGEYTCTGGACPAKNGADVGDVDTNAFDDDYQTRWSTGVYQSALDNQDRFPLYFTVDMKQSAPVSKITTHPGCKDYFDSPGTIEVEVSTNGTDFTTVTDAPHTPAVPSGEGCPPNDNAVATDTITFTTTCARYVRLKGTRRTTSDRYWAIGELNIYP